MKNLYELSDAAVAELPELKYTDDAICPVCNHFNAMLLSRSTVNAGLFQCRDCGYVAKVTQRLRAPVEGFGTDGPGDFRHKTATEFPNERIGYVLLDEEPGFTGIYIRAKDGGLWPARTVSHDPPEHHKSVCDAWLARPGEHEDKRTVKPE